MITYKTLGNQVQVKLDGKVAGHIKPMMDGFAYFPKGSKTGGDILPSVDAVKKTLESK